jgi:hypothetical protein
LLGLIAKHAREALIIPFAVSKTKELGFGRGSRKRFSTAQRNEPYLEKGEREKKEELDFLTDETNGEVNPHGTPVGAGKRGDEYGGGRGRETTKLDGIAVGGGGTWIWMDGGKKPQNE